MTKYLLFALSLVMANSSTAQEQVTRDISNPPIVAETFFGNKGYMGQLTIDKSFRPVPDFGFFSVTNMSANWGEQLIYPRRAI